MIIKRKQKLLKIADKVTTVVLVILLIGCIFALGYRKGIDSQSIQLNDGSHITKDECYAFQEHWDWTNIVTDRILKQYAENNATLDQESLELIKNLNRY